MIRFLLIVAACFVLIVLGVIVALARVMPMIPYPTAGAPMVGLGGPMVPGTTGGTFPPPPSCSGTIDLSTGCAMPMLGGA
jgi:hypothetical protein